MLSALTERERRILLAILAVLVLGAAVKLWRWQTRQHAEPVDPAKAAAEAAAAKNEKFGYDDRGAFPPLTTVVACGDGGRVARKLF